MMAFITNTQNVLVLTKDDSLLSVLESTLVERGIRFQVSDSYDDVDITFSLIIAGPDFDSQEIGQKLKEIGGIPPCILLLRTKAGDSSPIRCCQCKTLFLPMDIFQLPQALDQLLTIHH